MRYDECLSFLRALGHELHGAKFGLESITALLGDMGHPERRYPTAIVAGTNGKGSTCAMLAGILERAGYRTGLYTSPHLVRVNERIQISGTEISDEDFALAFSKVSDQVERLLDRKVLGRRPSFFEYLTATAFLQFARSGIEFAVLEVGMGGRLDATNVTEPAVAIITNIELDHQPFLGNTHAAIAWEKAGVIRPGKPVISLCENPEAAEVIRQRCRELGANLLETPQITRVGEQPDDDGCSRLTLRLDGDRTFDIRLPFPGSFQIRNALAAAAAARELARQGFTISGRAICEGLEKASWPGRLETISSQPLVVLDGAHNPAAAREVAQHVIQQWSGRTLRLVYGSMKDKSVEEISEILFPLAGEVFLTCCNLDRSAPPETILDRARFRPRRVVIEPDPVRALAIAVRSSAPEDVVLATGSLFLVGAIKKALWEGTLNLASPASAVVVSEFD